MVTYNIGNVITLHIIRSNKLFSVCVFNSSFWRKENSRIHLLVLKEFPLKDNISFPLFLKLLIHRYLHMQCKIVILKTCFWHLSIIMLEWQKIFSNIIDVHNLIHCLLLHLTSLLRIYPLNLTRYLNRFFSRHFSFLIY